MNETEESIAANLRIAYRSTLGHLYHKSWEETSEEVKVAWLLVARLARELWISEDRDA